MKFIEAPTLHVLPEREEQIRAVVLHTTGDTNIGDILRYYQSANGCQPHYCITLLGDIYRIVPEHVIAYHAGLKADEINLYKLGFHEWPNWTWDSARNVAINRRDFYPGYYPWKAQWYPLQSPLDLVTGTHPNGVSVGIELQQPRSPGKDIFTDAQYNATAELVEDICARYAIEPSRKTVLGHSDVSPLRRCTARGPWDPGLDFNWKRLFEMITQLPRGVV